MDPFYELHCRLESLISVTNRQMYRAIHWEEWTRCPLQKERKNSTQNTCRIFNKVQIMKYLSYKASCKVYKLSPDSTSRKIECFCKGVWVYSRLTVADVAV